MSYSLDTPSIQTLKSEAKALRDERAGAGAPLTQGAALEEVARRHGYRDWNTASAALPERVAVPVQVGQRVKGTYLSRPFTGLVIAMKLLADMPHYEVTVKFDTARQRQQVRLDGARPPARHRDRRPARRLAGPHLGRRTAYARRRAVAET